jgi:hypothetical protein
VDEGAHIGAMTPILRTAGHFRLRLAVSQWNRAGQGGQRQGSSFRSTFHVPRLEISALRKQRYGTLVSNWQLLGRPSASVFLARLSVLRPPAAGIRTRPYEYHIKDRLREQGVIYNRGHVPPYELRNVYVHEVQYPNPVVALPSGKQHGMPLAQCRHFSRV